MSRTAPRLTSYTIATGDKLGSGNVTAVAGRETIREQPRGERRFLGAVALKMLRSPCHPNASRPTSHPPVSTSSPHRIASLVMVSSNDRVIVTLTRGAVSASRRMVGTSIVVLAGGRSGSRHDSPPR